MKKKFIVIGIIIVFILCAIASYFLLPDSYHFKLEYEFYNNFAYKNGKYIKVSIPWENNIDILKEKEVLSALENKTGIFYFGYPDCPWCRNIIEVLVSVSNELDVPVYYVDVHKLEDSLTLISYLSDYLTETADGSKKLYVPDVYFIKDGKIMAHHVSCVESYKNPYLGMNGEQKEELASVYKDGISLMFKEENNE